ncbi:fumarylacetoacetate hydrolase family protein [Arthrobacter sp. GN70]|uniref:fumarylacetoacetate hydrolase family protein n=1 Tax=Arthrobacter TaxID=1663 RepID=UPI0035A94024
MRTRAPTSGPRGAGFTPVGRALIPPDAPRRSQTAHPHNSELVQNDITEGLLFPFDRLVADLSRRLALEEGEIIRTGTPAGASVAVPGDVLEVEASTADGGVTTVKSPGPYAPTPPRRTADDRAETR